MYIIIWEYQVISERQSEFEKIYASDGLWVELFKKSPGYLGSELWRADDQPLRYLTIDRWDSREAYENCLSQWGAEYRILDAQCAGLTSRESLLGRWGVDSDKSKPIL